MVQELWPGATTTRFREVKPIFGLRAALIVLVLIAIVPVFALVVRSSVSEEHAQLERAQSDLRSVVNLAAAHPPRHVSRNSTGRGRSR